jgi:hypothetical protein
MAVMLRLNWKHDDAWILRRGAPSGQWLVTSASVTYSTVWGVTKRVSDRSQILGCTTAAAAYCSAPATCTAPAQHNSGAAAQDAQQQQGEEMPELQKPKPRVRRAPARKRPKLKMEDLEVCSACWLQQAARTPSHPVTNPARTCHQCSPRPHRY